TRTTSRRWREGRSRRWWPRRPGDVEAGGERRPLHPPAARRRTPPGAGERPRCLGRRRRRGRALARRALLGAPCRPRPAAGGFRALRPGLPPLLARPAGGARRPGAAPAARAPAAAAGDLATGRRGLAAAGARRAAARAGRARRARRGAFLLGRRGPSQPRLRADER